MKSTINMALLDGDEKTRSSDATTWRRCSGLKTFMTWISGAARMPATKIFGKSPAGMNATGESDSENVLRPDPAASNKAIYHARCVRLMKC